VHEEKRNAKLLERLVSLAKSSSMGITKKNAAYRIYFSQPGSYSEKG
jgi:hypothetical protein